MPLSRKERNGGKAPIIVEVSDQVRRDGRRGPGARAAFASDHVIDNSYICDIMAESQCYPQHNVCDDVPQSPAVSHPNFPASREERVGSNRDASGRRCTLTIGVHCQDPGMCVPDCHPNPLELLPLQPEVFYKDWLLTTEFISVSVVTRCQMRRALALLYQLLHYSERRVSTDRPERYLHTLPCTHGRS